MAGSTKRTFKNGDILIRAGERGDCAYVVESGNVEILLEREGQLIQIGTRGPGSIIGEMAMIDDKTRTATVRALEDCTVMEISRDDFSRRVESADPVLKMVMHVIMTRYRDLIGRTQALRFPHIADGAEASENTHKNHAAALGSIKIHNELKNALDRKELTLHYQPIIDLQKMKIAGFEALMRWKHPERGMISPGIFIPVAEESGLIVELSKFALDLACDSVKVLQQAVNPALVPDPLFIAVNFSVKDFAAGSFYDQIEGTLKRKNVKPEQIHLEITETLLMAAPEPAKTALEQCRKLGVNVSIDDFGSGYSSLSYLHHFPIDTLKIDQSFVRAMTTHPASLVLVKSIIALAMNLGMRVVAEGIEAEKEAKILKDLDCAQAQGYWFAKPMPLEDALKFVQNWQAPVISG